MVERINSYGNMDGNRMDHEPKQGSGAIASVGEKMNRLGDSIKEHRPSGSVGNATDALAEGLKDSGKYLQEHGFQDMSRALGKIVRDYPVSSMWVGVGLGFIFGQALSRK